MASDATAACQWPESAHRFPVTRRPVNWCLKSYALRGGAFMLAAIISQQNTSPEHAKNTALCPSTFSSQPPITPPIARPIDCVVLYTPVAAPLRLPGASFDTSEGCDASRMLKPRK